MQKHNYDEWLFDNANGKTLGLLKNKVILSRPIILVK